MIALGTTVKSVDELLEMLKADDDYEIARYDYNELTKSLTFWDSDNMHTIVTLKNDEEGNMVIKRIW